MPRLQLLTLGLSLAILTASMARSAEPMADEVVAEASTRIPIEAFFSEPLLSHPRLSPEGKHIALLYSSGAVQAVTVRAAAGGELNFLGKMSDPEVRLASLEWASSQRLLFSVQARSAVAIGVQSRIHRLMSVALDGGPLKKLGERWPDRVQYQDKILHYLPDDPRHVLLEYRPTTSEWPLVQRLDVKSGNLRPIEKKRSGIHRWLVDHEGAVRGGEGFEGLGYALWARSTPDGKLTKVIAWETGKAEDKLRFVGFSYDPRKIYVRRAQDGRFAIFEYDLETRTLGTEIFSHPEYDAGDLIFDSKRRRLVAVEYIADTPVRRFLDPEARQEQESINRALPGTYNEVVSRSDDAGIRLIRISSDIQPPEYYALSGEAGKRRLDFVLDLYPDLPEEELVPMRPVSYKARDGLQIRAYLSVPKGQEAKNLPVVVLPHGGPTARDSRRFDPEVQFLANRGFAVFQMNFRGSSGYGLRHQIQGYRQWGAAMQDDVTDGVRWLIDQGIADPDRIGIYGSSYGGYAALMGLVKTPELFRAAASYAGVTSLPLLLETSQWYGFKEVNRPTIGGGWGDRARLRQSSPVYLAEKIGVPVLLAHGTDDQVVDVKHSQEMTAALRKAGKEVEYLEFENEFHGFLLEENRMSFYRRLAQFFAENLAPRQR